MLAAIIVDASEVEGLAVEHVGVSGLREVNGRPLVSYVMAAMQQGAALSRLVLMAPPAYRNHWIAREGVEVVPCGPDLASGLFAALERLGESERILVFPANAPLVTSAMFDNFLKYAPPGADLAYAVIREERVRERFPQVRRWPAQRFREGVMVPSRLALFRPQLAQRHRELLAGLISGALNPLYLLHQWGAGFLLRFKLGRVSLQEVVLRVGELLGGPCTAVISPYPELAFTVKSEADLQFVARELGSGLPTSGFRVCERGEGSKEGKKWPETR
ncbi:MAG TPA: hypothetical protein EYP85_12025 [Armatimonadetes bacterium]|nr:hypothetical protein [Armatimonadota bacterium]